MVEKHLNIRRSARLSVTEMLDTSRVVQVFASTRCNDEGFDERNVERAWHIGCLSLSCKNIHGVRTAGESESKERRSFISRRSMGPEPTLLACRLSRAEPNRAV